MSAFTGMVIRSLVSARAGSPPLDAEIRAARARLEINRQANPMDTLRFNNIQDRRYAKGAEVVLEALSFASASHDPSVVVDDQVLDLAHLVHGIARTLAPETGLLPPAERHVVDPINRDIVDHQSSNVPVLQGLESPAQVVGEKATLQAIATGIGARDRVIETAERIDGQHRPEDLFVFDQHAGPRPGKHRRLHDRILARTSREDLRSFALGAIDPVLDTPGRALVDDRTDIHALGAGVSYFTGFHLGDEEVHELVVHRFINRDPLNADAILTAVDNAAAHATGGCEFEIRIPAHDNGPVAAQFQRDALSTCDRLDMPADFGGSCERHHLKAIVAHHLFGERYRAVDDTQRVFRKTGVAKELGKQERGEWRLGGRFENDAIADGERRRDLVQDEVERKVEWGDREDWSQREAAGAGGASRTDLELIGIGVCA